MAPVKQKHATIIRELTALEEGIFERRRGQGGVCGGALHHRIGRRFKGEEITHLWFRQPPTYNNPHNNQLKIGGHGGGNIGEEVQPGVIVWRIYAIILGAIMINRIIKPR